jgi:hypothetical protein
MLKQLESARRSGIIVKVRLCMLRKRLVVNIAAIHNWTRKSYSLGVSLRHLLCIAISGRSCASGQLRLSAHPWVSCALTSGEFVLDLDAYGKSETDCPECGRDTAVASGAVLRALNRELGPVRIIQSSYGYLRTEPWDPDAIEAHRISKIKQADPNDGDLYVKNTICWVLKKVRRRRPGHK